MTVGVISTLFPSSRLQNSGIFIKDELDALSAHFEIKLLAPKPNRYWLKDFASVLPQCAYPVKRPPVFAFPRFFMQHLYPSSLAFVLGRNRTFFDDCKLVHAHNAFPEAVAAVKTFGKSHPLVVTVHGSDINYFAQKDKLRPQIIESLNSAKIIICVGSSLKKTLGILGVESETIVIPNGIDTESLKVMEKAEACSLCGLDPYRPRILFAGNFVKVKGIEYLIRSMPDVLTHLPECELVLLGASPSSPDRMRYDDEINTAGISKSMRIVERVPHEDLQLWINASDLLVLPSLKEGFGLVLAESLACGRPVVSTYSGGPEDIVGEGEGLLVEPANPDALADAIKRVLSGENIHDRASLVRSARERFSYAEIAVRIGDVYRKALAGK